MQGKQAAFIKLVRGVLTSNRLPYFLTLWLWGEGNAPGLLFVGTGWALTTIYMNTFNIHCGVKGVKHQSQAL